MASWGEDEGGKGGLSVALVSTVTMNPYVELLRRALDAIPGVAAQSQRELTPAWVWGERSRLQVIHLHWVELQIASPSRWRALKKFARLLAGVSLARTLGKTLVYTVHNVAHHEGQNARLNDWANRLIFRAADAIHVHDACVAGQVASAFGRTCGVYVVPHGNYIGAYPVHTSREEARQQLGLSAGDKVFLFLGQIRPYKGVEELIVAFRKMQDREFALVIAGHPGDAAYAARVEEMAKGDSRIHLHLAYVPDEDLHRYLLAADASVLPYREVTTSGAALLCFSFGLPSVAPQIGCFAGLLERNRGVGYDPDDSQGLERAMRQAAGMDREAVRADTLRFAESLGWDRLARQHLEAYRRARRGEA